MPDRELKFTLKDYEQLIGDVLNSYFRGLNVTNDLEELMKAQGNGEREVLPDEQIEEAV